MILHIALDFIKTSSISNRINVPTITPELPTPKLLFYLGKLLKHLNSQYALTYLHNSGRSVSRRSFHDDVKMITVTTKRIKC